MFKTFDSKDDLPENCIVFKHSSTCPVSAKANMEVEAFVQAHPDVAVYKLIVQEQPELKMAVAEEFYVKHESPQIIIIKDNTVKKVLNHNNITKVSIEDGQR